MKVEMVHVSRRPSWPLWAILLVFVWSGLGVSAIWLSARLERPVQLCLIKRLTGYPCPTCGSTRGALSLLHGHIIRTWLCNPLLFSVLGLLIVLTAVRVFFARGIKIYLTKNERIFAWIFIIVLFFANWTYVIFYVG
jgi:hypothetical protein